MHTHQISHETLANVAAKAFRNGECTAHAWRRKPISEEEIGASPVLNWPLRQYMHCGPDEARRPWCSVVPTSPTSTPTLRSTCAPAPCSPAGRAPSTDAFSEINHLSENGFCADGEQEQLIDEGATEIGGRLRSTPTAAWSPTASR